MPSGYIYVLTNTHPSFDGMVKIGKTTKDPKIRAAELSSGTGVVGSFQVFCSIGCDDIDHAEALIHQALKKSRVQPNREFFVLSAEKARQVAERCVSIVDDDLISSGAEEDPISSPSVDERAATPKKEEKSASLNVKPRVARLFPTWLPATQTQTVTKKCPTCSEMFSQTMVRGENVVRCPRCALPIEQNLLW